MPAKEFRVLAGSSRIAELSYRTTVSHPGHCTRNCPALEHSPQRSVKFCSHLPAATGFMCLSSPSL